ncbi:1-deoxy-D-xylulose-5-phosphate reductoisomerase [Neoehrlichia mikurensis]|uniref:1-deoxy-D-xylulose 5-phosphate reductoisomerase n=1 Tax=Neoehrlichia mikurensis TaxID=89586 RepID=A0A9Q9F3E5_9RICK|nr:1-deoxy-D-xylulose-5-phosphate reductoisomerase [Neoehrlichia mikurensis]QXK91996.1 1-deoxy-D-xylulose-5-phosphate reductoisomerase [Neoehrlichia mikurensis]QXK92453.1 1-deoxy-D-xylulose-5-phosphate reductoisomerase [Neoehrlichia mikurensis]QXK93689.1 1-deoxy-D-xylulose-5-phosphate reductoisomerase [Neoehrlichia mikurensis]UTO55339.1 1-deoxy-D-xylulose-5-phosphate reductoisomerase [Neoehrlichia mikurensis]UTO56260.1 1-deoxy-D-xylulose-5-phosphate reductoisomerase [Neoehrlichia mikurensis]
MKRVSIFGSTGVIGQKTVQILFDNPDDFTVEVLTSKKNIQLLALQARLINARRVVIADTNLYTELKELLSDTNIQVEAGEQGLKIASSLNVDCAVVAISGIAALYSVMNLIKFGVSTIALANKESIVCGGQLLLNEARKQKVNILPIDSEHNAIFQIFHDKSYIDKITLTASGGPFLFLDYDKMKTVTPKDTLHHPTWKMGKKISVDSATMMNKSLEVIEAYHLFSLNPCKIDIIIHPEAVIHGMISYIDGSSVGLMSIPDMNIPILYTLYWPERKFYSKKLDLISQGKLTFIKPNIHKFPALKLGFDVLRSSNYHANSIIVNAANEIAVNEFLNLRIGFLDIINIIYKALDKINYGSINSLASIIECDLFSRRIIKDIISSF